VISQAVLKMEIAWVGFEQLGHIRVTFDLSFPNTPP